MRESPEIKNSIHLKLTSELNNFIYSSLYTTLPLLVFIASMLVYNLNGHVNKTNLWFWLTIFLVAIVCQGALAVWFKKTKDSQRWDNVYFKLLIADVGLIGLLWGTAAILLMPRDTLGQSYLIFILSFVAAGGALYLARSYLAGAVYVTSILAPLVGSLIYSFFSKSHHEIYSNITLGLLSYWLFLLIVSYYASKLFLENFTHKLVNKILSEDLAHTNDELDKINIASSTAAEKLLSPNSIPENNKLTIDEFVHRDPLTGTDSREVLEIKYVLSRAYARRHYQSLAIFVIHINNFNDVKTMSGDSVADFLMKTAAVRLQYCKRETDILARITEDKFVLVLSEIVLGTEIMVVVNRILKIFAEKIQVDDNNLAIDSSIGISLFHKDGDNLSELILKSEIALSHLVSLPDQNKPHFQIYDPEIMKIKQDVNTNVADR